MRDGWSVVGMEPWLEAKPDAILLHVAPLSMDWNTPVYVAAKTSIRRRPPDESPDTLRTPNRHLPAGLVAAEAGSKYFRRPVDFKIP